jgi:protein-disulfide isomerase
VTFGQHPPAPQPAPPSSPAPRAWLGIIAVALGTVLMIAGGAAVYVYAKRHPLTAAARSASAAPAAPPIGPKYTFPTPAPSETAASPPAPSIPGSELPSAVVSAPFPEDALAVVPVDANRPLWGARDAPVTLTVFADLECPHSVALLRAVLAEKSKRGDALRLAFRHLPLSQHEAGERAAKALSQIHLVEGTPSFWRVLREIVRRGEPVDQLALDAAISAAGLSAYPISPLPPAVERTLEEDAVLAVRLFVRSTPTVFVNGIRLDGYQPANVLGDTVARELRSAELSLAGGVKKSELYAARSQKNLVNLGDEPAQRYCVPADDSPARGAGKDALVTIVEFSDFECEVCRQGEAALAPVLRAHARELRSVWKNFPLPQHGRARRAANFALEAQRLGGDAAFFTVASVLLARGATPDEAALERAAAAARVEGRALFAAAEGGAHEARIDGDVKLAKALGVTGAPSYFVNGRKIAGVLPQAELAALVREELALARRVRAQGSGSVSELACRAEAATAGR